MLDHDIALKNIDRILAISWRLFRRASPVGPFDTIEEFFSTLEGVVTHLESSECFINQQGPMRCSCAACSTSRILMEMWYPVMATLRALLAEAVAEDQTLTPEEQQQARLDAMLDRTFGPQPRH